MSISMGVLLPLPLNGQGVGYTCGALAEGMAGEDLRVTLVTSRNTCSLPSVEVIETLPKWARRVPYRWVRSKVRGKIEGEFLSSFDRCRSERSAGYLWPDAAEGTIRELRRRDITVFREQFNCHTATAKTILDHAYERLGVAPRHSITASTLDEEKRVLEAVDYVFCPSPLVEASLLENGVPARKLLKASYGWEPSRLSGTHQRLGPCEGITAVFVGTICVRKGVHLLLEYWVQSRIRGRLVLAGEMEPIIKQKFAQVLARDDVVVVDYFRDVGAIYRSADIFLFPSLEEGSPLVIYEACSSGLPIVTTAMGAGAVVRHNREGFVIDAYDAAGWVSAIRALRDDAELRQRMSRAAAERAQAYTWAAVASRRRQQVLSIMVSPSTNDAPAR
jgi:glycosyltransferase involved in cell wall biosynthesis